jgi:dTDP-4-dehydrorhamnose reductase
MKVLITGAKGQLGSELVRLSPSTDFEVHSVDHQQCNITDENRLKQVLESLSPDVVINAAAYTHVDGAESEPDRAYAVNKHGPAHLARFCAQNRRALIHISTDYVFDGSQNRPYRESDPISPVGIYGHSKAQGEASVRSVLKNHIIVRTSWLYGVYGHNFVKTILKLAINKKKLEVVADQWGSPTSAADLAAAVLIIVRKIGTHENFEWGTYHYCGAGITTWHALAEKTLELATAYADLQTRKVKAISTAEWPTPVSRPPYSALDCKRIKSQFGINPSPWQQSLKQVIERIYTTI